MIVDCRYLMDTHGNQVLASVRILLQHICTQVPDKTEYRAKVSEVRIITLALKKVEKKNIIAVLV